MADNEQIVLSGQDNLPCFGFFEMGDGKIAEWRDHFDMATYTKALA